MCVRNPLNHGQACYSQTLSRLRGVSCHGKQRTAWGLSLHCTAQTENLRKWQQMSQSFCGLQQRTTPRWAAQSVTLAREPKYRESKLP